jgi:hypothetical protein
MADMMRRPEPERNGQSGAPRLGSPTSELQVGTIAATRRSAFDPAALMRQFVGLADAGLGYLDSAAGCRRPYRTRRRFEVEVCANLHEALMRRPRGRRLRPFI